MDPEDAGGSHELMSTLKSELAALQFKRDRLMSEVSARAPPRVGRATSQFRRPFTAARHQRAVAVQGPEGGRARGRDGNVEGTASSAKLDNRQPEESNKSTVYASRWSGYVPARLYFNSDNTQLELLGSYENNDLPSSTEQLIFILPVAVLFSTLRNRYRFLIKLRSSFNNTKRL